MSKYAYISAKNDLSTQKSMLRKSIAAFNNRFNNKYAMRFDTLSPKTVLELYLRQFSDRMTGKCIKTRKEADAILMAYMSANTRFKNVTKELVRYINDNALSKCYGKDPFTGEYSVFLGYSYNLH